MFKGLESHSGSGGKAGAARSEALEMDVPTPIKPWYRAIVSLVQMLVGAICIQVGMKEEDYQCQATFCSLLIVCGVVQLLQVAVGVVMVCLCPLSLCLSLPVPVLVCPAPLFSMSVFEWVCISVVGICPDAHAHAQLLQISRQVGAQGEEPRAVLWFIEVVLWISVLHAVVTNSCENLKLQARFPSFLRGGFPFLARERELIRRKRIVEEAGWGGGACLHAAACTRAAHLAEPCPLGAFMCLTLCTCIGPCRCRCRRVCVCVCVCARARARSRAHMRLCACVRARRQRRRCT